MEVQFFGQVSEFVAVLWDTLSGPRSSERGAGEKAPSLPGSPINFVDRIAEFELIFWTFGVKGFNFWKVCGFRDVLGLLGEGPPCNFKKYPQFSNFKIR